MTLNFEVIKKVNFEVIKTEKKRNQQKFPEKLPGKRLD